MSPNIVFIMADQWAAASLGCYGCDVADVSPHLDAMARGGVRFGRHIANVPVCGPSRATIFTGRSPAAHGVWHNNIEISPDTPLFTRALQKSGYQTSGIGKFHFSPMQEFPPRELRHLGFEQVLISEDPKHGPYLEWVCNQHPSYYETALAMAWPMPYIENYPPHGENLRPQWQAAFEKHLQPKKKSSGKQIFYPSPLPAELHQSAWIADRAIETLEAQTNGDAPFFLFVSFVDPHDPYDPPAPYDAMFDPRDMPTPINQEWSREFCAREYARFQKEMFEISSFEASDWAKLRALFYGSCRFVDDQIGRILQTLKETGLDENTIVVFTTDHGDCIGDHGLLMKGPWHYDKVIRCPLIFCGPGVERGEICEKLTCSLDIAPTLLGLAGLESELEGKRLPLSQEELQKFAGWREVVVESSASYVNSRGGCRTLISDDNWRFTLFPGQDYGELFDLASDPDEQNNCFLDPKFAERRSQMAERLIGAMARQIYPFPRGEFAEF